ncbi:MAG: shikimate kinase / 3-dehydroquinate synthase, partial [Thermoleophilaceae bacterium]|nr:shikimate kinase / 3-dehydroquinate synthase [Thermoleophilaceae bacterium]
MEAVTAAGSSESGSGGARRALVFVGFMGAGKSSAVRSVAAEMGVEPLDSDKEFEGALGEPLEAFFDREGEAEFRRREEDLICALLERPDARAVALGGGALGSERVRDALAGHVVVHMDVDPAAAWRRASGKGRPLARDRGRFTELYEQRRATYDSVSHATLPPADRGQPLRALPALLALAEAPEGTRLVWAAAASGDYPVFVGR